MKRTLFIFLSVVSVAGMIAINGITGKVYGQSGKLNDHEYVDLGLPSGTKWATCNVGANTPEEYGDFFAWGETTPKEKYSDSTYKYYNGKRNTLTKYCKDPDYGYNGFTDTLTILEASDDAATSNWGSGWRMPTEAEFMELKNNCVLTWITRNGVNGLLCTGPNGNSIFLSAAGERYDTEGNFMEPAKSYHEGVGSRGYYWSCSGGYNLNAIAFMFKSNDNHGSISPRTGGRTVRPVCIQ